MTVARDRSPELPVPPHPHPTALLTRTNGVHPTDPPLGTGRVTGLRPATTATASPDYEHWNLADLRLHARDVGIPGRSTMRKHELIAALRAR